MSLIKPLAETLTLSSALAAQFAFSAASIAETRITPSCEAPVAATLTSPALVLVTNTPVSAKREAGWRNLAYPPFAGTGTETAVMIAPSSSAVVNRPLKKSSDDIERLLVFTVAPSETSAAGKSAAGSLLAIEPPIVPRWRTAGSPSTEVRKEIAGIDF